MLPGLVQIFPAMRANRMGVVARIAAIQNMADSLMTLALVAAWPSAMAIVLPKRWRRRSGPCWPAWHSVDPGDLAVRPAPFGAFALFAPLGTELLNAARLNADKLIVGSLMGTKVLGLYYFAFNAGLGITQSFVAACNLVVFPHLAGAASTGRWANSRKAFAIGLTMLLVSTGASLAALRAARVRPAMDPGRALYRAAVMRRAAALRRFAVGASLRVQGKPQGEAALTGLATIFREWAGAWCAARPCRRLRRLWSRLIILVPAAAGALLGKPRPALACKGVAVRTVPAFQ